MPGPLKVKTEMRPRGLNVCSGARTDDKLDPAKLQAFFAAIGDGDGFGLLEDRTGQQGEDGGGIAP